ncbi:type IV pilin protein [Psychromonas hadalis]|uniref:type IV pilin protein n=1 Tax=Psychromonas hadalis TaxID=211669 RepID=UPI0003B4DC29|nr:type IV pilin protein [Psychromonas hadalis]
MEDTKGFTLIELLIVIAIIGILVSIALPSYQAHVRKANRIEVQLEMTELSLVAERYYARQGGYPATTSADIVGSYSVQYVKPLLLEKFTITATAQGAQTLDECGNMTLDQAGTFTVSGSFTAEKCW